MVVINETIEIKTAGFPSIIDLSRYIEDFLSHHRMFDGLLTIFVPGSTAGVTTIEYEPGLLKDLPALCEKLAPRNAKYMHDETWHDGNGYAHLLAAIFKPSLQIPVQNGQPVLGTWQQVVLADFDNRPRHRKIALQYIGTLKQEN